MHELTESGGELRGEEDGELNKNSSIIGAVPDTLRLSVNTESWRLKGGLERQPSMDRGSGATYGLI